MPRQPGCYDGIPEDEYHAGPEVSVSKLKVLAEEGGPAKVRYGERVETRAQALGTLIHCAILEPNRLDQRYAVTDLERTGTKAWAEAEVQAMGRQLIKRPEMVQALRIRDSVLAHPIVRELVDQGLDTEQSIYWTDAETQLPCRGRVDALQRDWRVVMDLKSTEDASAEGIDKSIRTWAYHWQEAFYRGGLSDSIDMDLEAFLFVFVEKDPPYLRKVVRIDDIDVNDGRYRTRDMLRLWAECERTGIWRGYTEEIEHHALPEWFRRK